MNHTAKQFDSHSVENSNEVQIRRYVHHLRRFYHKLIAYGVLVLFLFAINFLTSPDYWWAIWPTLAMGIDLALRAARLLSWKLFWNKDWEDRKVARMLSKRGM